MENNQELLAFLKAAYFNIYGDENEDDILQKCAEKAYSDMCRTLRFNDAVKGNKKQKERRTFRNNIIENNIKGGVKKLKSCESIDEYDKEHEKICNGIIKAATKEYKEYNGVSFLTVFSYGQAQKWLNMTMKYMWMLGQLDGNKNMASFLHAPLDSIVMKEAKKVGAVVSDKAWSSLSKCEYCKVQDSLRVALKGQPPIEWEFNVWIEKK